MLKADAHQVIFEGGVEPLAIRTEADVITAGTIIEGWNDDSPLRSGFDIIGELDTHHCADDEFIGRENDHAIEITFAGILSLFGYRYLEIGAGLAE